MANNGNRGTGGASSPGIHAGASALALGDGSSQELTGAQQVGMRPILIRDSLEDPYDTSRPDVDGWQGATITNLKEVLAFVDPARPGD